MLHEPPPGYADCESDAEDHPTPPGHPYRELEVDGIGVLRARKPLPNAVAVIAGAANAKISTEARTAHLQRFIANHLAPEDYEGLLARMIDPDDTLPPDALLRVSRAIATAGTARPTVPSST